MSVKIQEGACFKALFQKHDFCMAIQSGERTDTSLDGFPDMKS